MRNTWIIPAIALLLLGAAMAPAGAADQQEPLDLNRAVLEEVAALPIPAELARSIIDYRTYVRFFASVYDLMEVEGMTADYLAVLRPLVSTLPPDVGDASMARLTASYRQAARYLGQEGASEGLVDEYLDMLRDPVDVNDLDIFDLQSFQNVSPVDAKNILKSRNRLGRFDEARQLRASENLRYWAYRNIRDFVYYTDAEKDELQDKIHGNYQVRYYDSPYMLDDEEITADSDRSLQQRLIMGDPHMTHKLTLNLGGGVRAGLLTHRNMGEQSWSETLKGYYGVDNQHFGPFHLKRLYFGNYRLSFGQGLIMDNTDFAMYRKTGYGWNKRPQGVRGDLSRSHEYALTGVAVEGAAGPIHATFFSSWEKKDGILNTPDPVTGDVTVNRYVTMEPRLENSLLDNRLTDTFEPTGLRRDAFEEDIVGGNIKLMLGTATYVGITGYEAKYDKAFSPDPATLVADLGKLETRDSEILAGYNSVEIDPETGERTFHKFRRVYGAEFQTVFDNVAFQGEYGVLQDPKSNLFHGDNKDALVLNGYAQWDDLHLLGIFRDYDLGYDNPYNRAFANDNRYEQTLLDAPYRMKDDLYSWLSLNEPQPKPEKGIFLQTRYRISRSLILNGLEYDQWQRQADGTDLTRYTVKVEYQPIFNLRLRMRHRYSSRSESDISDVRWFQSWESRWELISMLSNYDRLKFMYMTSNVWFPPRQRLSGTPEPGSTGSGLGTAAIPAHAFQVMYEHHFTPYVRLLVSTEMYDGFLWNFEGNEFVVVDGRGFRNWAKIESRVSERLLFQLKVMRDHNLPLTYLDVREYGDVYGPEPESSYVPNDWTTFRMQLDYSF